jgi:glucokinase
MQPDSSNHDGRPAVGVDIGGSAVKLGLVSAEGGVLARRAIPFDPNWSFAACAAAIGDAVAALMVGAPVLAVGVGVPAYPHPETGALMAPVPNVPPLAQGSLKQALGARFGLPVLVGNDGVCAARAERDFGAGRPFRRFAVLTLGTGIGGAVVIDGQIIDGPEGLTPEIGAICLDPSRTDLPDGVPGAFEYLASAAALARRYRELSGDPAASDARIVVERARAGEALALQVMDEEGRWIAQVVGILSNMLNLEAIILGGGLSHAGDILLAPVQKHAPGFYWAPFHRPPRIMLAEHRNDAGIIGAASLCFEPGRVTGL